MFGETQLIIDYMQSRLRGVRGGNARGLGNFLGLAGALELGLFALHYQTDRTYVPEISVVGHDCYNLL